MSKYRQSLPQLENQIFISDSGLETCLIFHDGIELPDFASFTLLKDTAGRLALQRYYDRHIDIAAKHGLGFILESPTWRASPDWGERLGYSRSELAAVNRDAVAMMETLRARHDSATAPVVVSGNIGPRGDGYDPGKLMSVRDAQAYHAWQIEIFAATDADMVCAMTLTNTNEAVGVTRAARAAGMPVALSFTLETDGRLPTGETLAEAIETVDQATDGTPAYYMINCAHPTHFEAILDSDAPWTTRIRGLRANASRRSHAELNEAPDLDAGDPVELGAQYGALRRRQPQLSILGGCCGTDYRHVEKICEACLEAA